VDAPEEAEDGKEAEQKAQDIKETAAEAEEDELGQDMPVDDDEDDIPVTRRSLRTRGSISQPTQSDRAAEDEPRQAGARRLTRKAKEQQKSAQEPSSDFEPGDDDGDESIGSAKDGEESDQDDESSPMPRGRRSRQQSKGSRRKTRRDQDSGDEGFEELDKDEMAEELEELRQSSRSRMRRRRRSTTPIRYDEPKRRRTAKPVDYSIKAIDPAFPAEEDDDEPAPTPARRGGRGRPGGATGWERSFNTTYGPFGGGGGAGALLKGPWGAAATGGVDSDSSDDERVQRPGVGGAVGMTPTSAVPPGGGLFPGMGQPLNLEGLPGVAATPNVGKVKNTKALADADPLGVDLNVDFSKVGGLQGHIDQLKEMVQLPLLYPELFLKFHVTPPRGVLFHGPPGTGKTLLARALANSVGQGGRKISFYMRKGADALSKWVGEAEKQLRLLFEEARRTQPSIIFFDEIDGLAPVRSSKQEQIHASIVSTLLALMDGMDGRGQVIVIGATNRPDNIDPALRRPGRFDREFYFPLPDKAARRAILDIHTKDWGLSEDFRDSLAERTKGYGGADLRALATEAALNSIQRTYPQIYSAPQKLVVNPDLITVQATDFMLSMKKMVPSSERSATSAATALPKAVEPLLRNQLRAAKKLLDEILPRKKKTTALEEAMFEPLDDDDHGFGREQMLQEFDRARVFRPRLLLGAQEGMGQEYLASALLHQLEGVHIQNLDLANLMGDGRVSTFSKSK
jgi:ATPase family AAA domain-containing protein 2